MFSVFLNTASFSPCIMTLFSQPPTPRPLNSFFWHSLCLEFCSWHLSPSICYPASWPHLQRLLQASLQGVAEHHNSNEQAADQRGHDEPSQQENFPAGEAAGIQGVLTHATGHPVGADGGQAHHHQDVGHYVDLRVLHHLKERESTVKDNSSSQV